MKRIVARYRFWRLRRLLARMEHHEEMRDRIEVRVILLKRSLGLASPRPEKTQVLETLWQRNGQ